MHIKRAVDTDLERILELQYLAYQSEAKLLGDVSIPPLRQTLEDITKEFHNGIVLKAVRDTNDIIGSVRAYTQNESTYIGKLMVHPSWQGQGIGSSLLQAIEQECLATRYELFTSDKSLRNLQLYKRLGYQAFRTQKISETLCFLYLEKYALA